MKTKPSLMQRALLQVQTALAKERDGTLPDSFTWEEFKYAVVDPAVGNDGEDGVTPEDYDPNFCGIMDEGACEIAPEDWWED